MLNVVLADSLYLVAQLSASHDICRLEDRNGQPSSLPPTIILTLALIVTLIVYLPLLSGLRKPKWAALTLTTTIILTTITILTLTS